MIRVKWSCKNKNKDWQRLKLRVDIDTNQWRRDFCKYLARLTSGEKLLHWKCLACLTQSNQLSSFFLFFLCRLNFFIFRVYIYTHEIFSKIVADDPNKKWHKIWRTYRRTVVFLRSSSMGDDVDECNSWQARNWWKDMAPCMSLNMSSRAHHHHHHHHLSFHLFFHQFLVRFAVGCPMHIFIFYRLIFSICSSCKKNVANMNKFYCLAFSIYSWTPDASKEKRIK